MKMNEAQAETGECLLGWLFGLGILICSVGHVMQSL